MTWVRRFALRACCLVPVMTVVASPSLLPDDAVQAHGKVQIERQLQNSLARMSTGKDQELMLAGVDAQSRNTMIPTVGLREDLSSYSPVAPSSALYPMALRCMTQAIYYEAANESEKGKRAVAQVVMNRMRHPAYPNSICGVVYQGSNNRVCQFSFTCDGALLRKPLRKQWQESSRLAKRALAGEQLSDVGTATHYHADYVLPKWAFTLKKLEVIGTHIFYRFPGRSGGATAFRSKWSKFERIPRLDWSKLARSRQQEQLAESMDEERFVPGLTVAPDPTDRHAETDVGGRLDTTKEWRLTIPGPSASKKRYDEAIAEQSDRAADDNEEGTLHSLKEPVG